MGPGRGRGPGTDAEIPEDGPLPESQCVVGNGRTIAWTAHDDEFSSRDRSLAVAEQPAEGREADVKLNGELHRDHRPTLRCDELEAMLIYSMSVSVDGFIADREGAFGWTVPGEEQFRFHIAQIRELGGYLCGRRLYETMLPWGTDPSMRDDEHARDESD